MKIEYLSVNMICLKLSLSQREGIPGMFNTSKELYKKIAAVPGFMVIFTSCVDLVPMPAEGPKHCTSYRPHDLSQ